MNTAELCPLLYRLSCSYDTTDKSS